MITFERFARITTERLSGVGSLSVDTSEEVGSWTWAVLLSNGMVGVAAVYDEREKRLFGYLVRPKQGLFRRARLPSPGELDETNWFLIEEIAARRGASPDESAFNRVVTEEELGRALDEYVDLLRHVEPELNGDVELMEEIVRERRLADERPRR